MNQKCTLFGKVDVAETVIKPFTKKHIEMMKSEENGHVNYHNQEIETLEGKIIISNQHPHLQTMNFSPQSRYNINFKNIPSS